MNPWHFVNPPMKAGRVPFGRAVVVLQLIAAITFVGYTAIKKGIRIPFVSSAPFVLEVEVADAKGLIPSKGPSVGVAGAPAGKVESVRVERGRALVTLQIDDDYRDRVFNDATAIVRPTSALQTLMINIDPGTPATGEIEAGEAIPVARTSSFVHIDELTETLDADTQAQVQVLVRELSGALDGREPELREILGEVGRLTDGATPLARALSDRRVLLRDMTDHLDVLFGTLGERGDQLAAAVTLGNETLEVTSRRAPQLEAGLRLLAPTLEESRRSLASVRRLAEPLSPAIDELLPVAGRVGTTATRLRGTLPELGDFISAAEPVAREGRKPARQLARGLDGQAELIANDQTPALKELIGLVELLERNRDGVIQFAQNLSGATSVSRRGGVYGQFDIMNFESSPGAFGFGAAAARSVHGRPSRLARLLAELLEHTCRQNNPAACVIRFQIPGLPAIPVLTDGGKR